MLDPQQTFKKKDKVTLGSFRNFAYISNLLHLKSFAGKRDCLIFSELQTPRTF